MFVQAALVPQEFTLASPSRRYSDLPTCLKRQIAETGLYFQLHVLYSVFLMAFWTKYAARFHFCDVRAVVRAAPQLTFPAGLPSYIVSLQT